ncbi:unnamed protein product [Urochloa decumbens]|uniref:MATH domain-containing protein n=1 Tax=Urochloa decumbens TaxID=240449 RepID=A0ABC8XZ98_9POAL
MGNTCVTSGRAVGNPCITDVAPAPPENSDDPAFRWKIYGFSTLLERGAIPAFSAAFNGCGYKWRLVLQVNQMHKNDAGIPYVALGLELAERSSKSGLVLNAVFELSIYNHSDGTYCRYKDSHTFRVIKNKTPEKSCVIPPELLKSYSCVFGGRILKVDVPSKRKPIVVPNKPTIVQTVFLQNKEFIQGNYSWTINKFRAWKILISSPSFEVCGHKWLFRREHIRCKPTSPCKPCKLQSGPHDVDPRGHAREGGRGIYKITGKNTWHITMFPYGYGYAKDFVSMYLNLNDPKHLPPQSGMMMIELTLSILDQEHGQHYTHQGRFPFSSKTNWGWPYFVPLKTLKDPSKGYLVGSKCVVKADITIIGSYKY